MPRHASGHNEPQRLRQRRYRSRLRSQRVPEADAVDTALAASFTAWLAVNKRQSEEAMRNYRERKAMLQAAVDSTPLSIEEHMQAVYDLKTLTAPVAVPVAPKVIAKAVVDGAISLLVDDGYKHSEAEKILVRRLGRGGDPTRLERLITSSGIASTVVGAGKRHGET